MGWVVRILILNYKGQQGKQGKRTFLCSLQERHDERTEYSYTLERARSDMRLMMIEIIQTSVSTSTSSEARTAR